MKKIIFGFFLIFLMGCETPTVEKTFINNNYIEKKDNNNRKQEKEKIDCKGNMNSLWEEYVTKKNTFGEKNIINESLTKRTKETFLKLNCEIENIRKFLILGRDFDDPGEEEPVWKDGLTKISDENNEELINQLKQTLELVNGNGEDDSLVKELEEFKEGIKNVCDRQKILYKCDL